MQGDGVMFEKRVYELVELLNTYREEYYNKSEPSVTDKVYDSLFDELNELEEITGIYLQNSPTQSVGYEVINTSEKVVHKKPILSLDRTKNVRKVVDFIDGNKVLFMHKVDGITIVLEYVDGKLACASTRGNGKEGRNITDSVYGITGVPLKISYKKRLIVVGEGYVKNDDYIKAKNEFLDSNGKPYVDARNFASKSIQSTSARICKKYNIRFMPFNILNGLDEDDNLSDSKLFRLKKLTEMNFNPCELVVMDKVSSVDSVKNYIKMLHNSANKCQIPVDGIVVTFDSIAYSELCGRTKHHYNDAIAFKF